MSRRGRAVAVLLVAAAAVPALLMTRGDDQRVATNYDRRVAAECREAVTAPDAGPVRDGDIVHAGGGRSSQPPGSASRPGWVAFDQRTGRFLHASGSGCVSVVDGAKSISTFKCTHAHPACDLIAFGPGRDELTVPADEPGGLGFLQTARIVSFDGEARGELDLTAAVTTSPTGEPEPITDLAWSPDGSRLAVGTGPGRDCRPGRSRCEGRVWVFDRDDGEPRLVLRERASKHLVDGQVMAPLPGNLAWSPRGHRLALVMFNHLPQHAAARGIWPRLIGIRVPPGRRHAADTLHAYDDRVYKISAVPDDLDRRYAFAWSPDATRIAILGRDEIVELSAEDGRRLARRKTSGRPRGPLAWPRGD